MWFAWFKIVSSKLMMVDPVFSMTLGNDSHPFIQGVTKIGGNILNHKPPRHLKTIYTD
jgi:hypothetical protein